VIVPRSHAGWPLSLGNYISDRTVILRYGAVVEIGPTLKVFGNPQHPYTKALLASVPQLHKKWQKRPPETASVNGVRRSAMPLEPPPLRECEQDHLVAALE
jgi:ABC-type oligopeptide transport system ATPase subunit